LTFFLDLSIFLLVHFDLKMAADIKQKPIFNAIAIFCAADKDSVTDPKTKEVTVKHKLLFSTETKVVQNKRDKIVPLNAAYAYYPPNLRIGVSPEQMASLKNSLFEGSVYSVRLCPASWISGDNSGVWYELIHISSVPDSEVSEFDKLEKSLL